MQQDTITCLIVVAMWERVDAFPTISR